jgi:hypothetical protein
LTCVVVAAVKTIARPRTLAAVVAVAVAVVAVAVLGAGVVAVAVAAVGVGVSVGVGVGVGVGVVGVGVGVGVRVGVGVGVGVGVVGVGVGVADGFAVVEVFEGDGLGEAAGGWIGSHDSILPDVAAVAAAALPAVAARTPPEATVTRTLPAAKLTAVRRARAKPMSMSRPLVRRVAAIRPTWSAKRPY